MKEMEYKNRRTLPEVLEDNYYKDYRYFIISYGTHPCAYIALSEGQPFYNVADYDSADIVCHGGLTYASWGYPKVVNESYKVLGWDYAHCDDFTGNFLPSSKLLIKGLKMWTTEEMVQDCKNVIDQLYVREHVEVFYV